LIIKRLLIANRGEIACRVIETCQRLGINSVAVFSSCDANARHVRMADKAIGIGAAPPADSYLRADRILDAARETGADAIHPGYGFLSENAEFAEACGAAGITWVGPSAGTIQEMGSKRRARRIMQDAGVQVVPGYDGKEQDDETLEGAAGKIGYPLIIKATAGGGGKGMRVVRSRKEWAQALAGARREALAAFGDDRVILERYLERTRHIEFQIFADSHDNVIHLFDRECSIQRRYQKIIEETPAAMLDETLRDRMGQAAVSAARAAGYVNAGTVEFLVSDNDFYFMEMNTRLQVEHPVTEAVTCLDLVEWQLRIASGETLPISQDEVTRSGHAIEARLYAEDPFEAFLPSTGHIGRFRHPTTGRELRVDTGVAGGDEVSIYYDPMLAKIISWGEDRQAAIRNLRLALARTVLTGPRTNLPLLRGIVSHEDFAAAKMDTGYLDLFVDEIIEAIAKPDEIALTSAACAVLLDRPESDRLDEDSDPHSPWSKKDGWRAGGGGVRVAFEDRKGVRHEVHLTGWGGNYVLDGPDGSKPVRATRATAEELDLDIDGRSYNTIVIREGRTYFVGTDDCGVELEHVPLYATDSGRGEEDTHPGAPMPGRIVAIHVEEGMRVEPGQALLVLEGMKMEYTLASPAAGVVTRVLCEIGQLVEAEVPLVDIDREAKDGRKS
jgi:3-methylcrotonyl-CoA carboxylase alpha subunit